MQLSPATQKKDGFTLVELSVVLVVVALLVGGIVVGKSLIHASEIRAVISDVNRFKTEISAFRLKYGALPGDIPFATSYLDATATNGDGDSQIDYLLGAPGEEYNAWNHLSLAKMTAGNYDGTTTSLPKSKLGGGYYRISFQTNVYGKNANMISFNAMNVAASLAHNAILSPTDAFSIDAKMDDGLADKGRVFGINPSGVPGCVTNYYSASSGDYILTNSDILCKLFFSLDY